MLYSSFVFYANFPYRRNSFQFGFHFATTVVMAALRAVIGAAIGAVVSGAVMVVAAPLALAAVGFGTSGVAAGSLAAAIQSIVFGPWTYSVFSVLQSWGAAGIPASTVAAVTGTGAAAGGVAGGVSSKSSKAAVEEEKGNEGKEE